jgi:cytochrome c553
MGWLLCASSGETAEGGTNPAAIEFFEMKVRPVLVAQCQNCHGTKKRGNLLLDSRAGLLKGGDTGPAIVPGEPEKSLLIKAISYRDQLRMPPRSKLSDEQIADLTAWVKMGAPWPGAGRGTASEEKIDLNKRLAHWSFQPVRPQVPPAVKDGRWARTVIDRFLLARLQARGLSPVAAADRRTLLRRASYDLTGMPPTPAETEAFLVDPSPDAYERVIDRLLASPAYGERWGRHWLDLVRFAETSGHEFDFDIPHASGYRDYIIRALNDDVPYDQLVREHLAGDLLREPRRHPADRTNESILGTGFWFLGESKHSPVDLRGDGADRRDNMIDVLGKAFVGLTIACARCHDHKFDPISTREYYSLVSYLQSSRMQRAFLDPPARIAEPAARLLALRRQAATWAIRASANVLSARLKDLDSVDKSKDDLFHIWRTMNDSTAFATKKRDLLAQVARQNKARKACTSFETFSGGDYRDWYTTGEAFGPAPAGSNDVEVQSDQPVPVRRLIRGASSKVISSRLEGALRSRTFTIHKKYILYRARGQGIRVNLIIDGFQQIRDPIYGGLTFGIHAKEPRWFVQDVSMWVGLQGYIEVLDDGDGAVELEKILFSDQSTPPPDAPNPLLIQLVERSSSVEDLSSGYGKLLGETLALWRDGKLTGSDRLDLLDSILRSEGLRGEQRGSSPPVAILCEINQLEASLPRARRGLALADGTGIRERVHIRGNPRTLGEEAERVLPAVLKDPQPATGTGSGRLEMAQRFTSSNNPLFARVIVNRLWHHHFGAGLVRSTDDFGHQGDRPTHPELLDWLAGELVQSGWSLKHMHRLMVLSSAYRMSSQSDDIGEKTDPRNELLHRMPIRRLEAEAIRDGMLAVSGQLNRSMYGSGPGPHLSEFMLGRGRPGASGPLDGAGRRSVYLNVRRNFLTPMFLAFDYPTPFTTIGRRSVSNVPAQALTLLNNPFVTQQARLWAERILAQASNSDRARIAAMYEIAFARQPTEKELGEALAFLDGQAKEYGRLDVRAWADLAHVLFNVKEFIFVH